jgi:hypothetical protein
MSGFSRAGVLREGSSLVWRWCWYWVGWGVLSVLQVGWEKAISVFCNARFFD